MDNMRESKVPRQQDDQSIPPCCWVHPLTRSSCNTGCEASVSSSLLWMYASYKGLSTVGTLTLIAQPKMVRYAVVCRLRDYASLVFYILRLFCVKLCMYYLDFYHLGVRLFHVKYKYCLDTSHSCFRNSA